MGLNQDYTKNEVYQGFRENNGYDLGLIIDLDSSKLTIDFNDG